MPASAIHKGWYNDIANARLQALYNGTSFLNADASSITFPLPGTFSSTLAVNGVASFSVGPVFADDVGVGVGTGTASQFMWVTDDANANKLVLQLPAGGAVDVPVLAIGQGAGLLGDLALWNGVVDPLVSLLGSGAVATGPVIEGRKARGTLAAPTVVTSGDDVLSIRGYAAVAAGEWVQTAEIRMDVAGTISTTRGPGTITFLTATDAAPSVLTTALTIGSDQRATFGHDVYLADSKSLIFGTGADAWIAYGIADANANKLLVRLPAGGGVDVPVIAVAAENVNVADLGLHNGIVDPTIALLSAGAWATGSVLEFRHARGTLASPTVVTSGDDLGRLNFYGAVAAGEYVLGASIEVDMVGTIATTRGPSTITFKTATDAAPSVLTSALTLAANQAAVFGGRQVLQLTNTDVDAQSNTLTIAQIAGGIVTHTSVTGGGTVTTDTAANIIAGSGAAPALTANGQTLVVYYINDGDQTLTFAGGDSVTVSDTGNTVLINEAVTLLFVRTGAGTVTMHIIQ